MLALLAYLFYFVAASVSPLQRRWLAKRHLEVSNDGQIRLAFYAMLIVALSGVFLLFIEPIKFQGDLLTIVLLGLVTAVIGGGLYIPNYIAQKHVEAGVTNIVMNIYTPVAIVLASLFLHESLTLVQIGGTALLLVGMLVVSRKHRVGRFKFDKYFLMMLASGTMLGVCIAAERALQLEAGFTLGTLISWWSQTIFLGILVLFTKTKNEYTPIDISVTGVLRALQAFSWVILLFVVGNLSVVSAVTTFKVVIIFLAGALFLGEREDFKRKLAGSVVALLGLLLM